MSVIMKMALPHLLAAAEPNQDLDREFPRDLLTVAGRLSRQLLPMQNTWATAHAFCHTRVGTFRGEEVLWTPRRMHIWRELVGGSYSLPMLRVNEAQYTLSVRLDGNVALDVTRRLDREEGTIQVHVASENPPVLYAEGTHSYGMVRALGHSKVITTKRVQLGYKSFFAHVAQTGKVIIASLNSFAGIEVYAILTRTGTSIYHALPAPVIEEITQRSYDWFHSAELTTAQIVDNIARDLSVYTQI